MKFANSLAQTFLMAVLCAMMLASFVAPAQAQLMGYWNFNDDTASDLTGNGYNGTLSGAGGVYSSDTPAALGGGRSVNLTGGDSYVLVGGTGDADFNIDTIAVSAWIKGWPDNDWEPFVSKQGEGAGWQLRREGGNNVQAWTVRGTSGADDPAGTANLNNSNWKHVVGIYDGTSRRFYVDGVLDGSIANDRGPISDTLDSVVFGARDNGGIGAFARIQLDDVAIWKGALSPEKVSALAAGANPLTVQADVAYNFSGNDLNGWTEVSGDVFFRGGNEGGFVASGNGGAGEAGDGNHPSLIFRSPEFHFTGDTVDGTNVLAVSVFGGTGNEDNVAITSPADVLALNGGQAQDAGGVQGVGLLNTNTGNYDATIFVPSDGYDGNIYLSKTDADNLGIDSNTTYQLDFFDNDTGSWGWSQLRGVSLAAEAGAAAVPEPGSIAIWAMLGVAAIGFGGYRWRRRNAK